MDEVGGLGGEKVGAGGKKNLLDHMHAGILLSKRAGLEHPLANNPTMPGWSSNNPAPKLQIETTL